MEPRSSLYALIMTLWDILQETFFKYFGKRCTCGKRMQRMYYEGTYKRYCLNGQHEADEIEVKKNEIIDKRDKQLNKIIK